VSERLTRIEPIEIPLLEPVHGLKSVTGALGTPEWWPTGSRICVVIAQASAAEDPLLDALQHRLSERRFLSLRFPMPYMAAGKRREDDLRVMRRTYQAAVAVLGRDPTAAPAHVFAGGMNIGALVAAHAAATHMRIEGLFFLGYPLPNKDETKALRDERLYRIVTPMLFVQGTRDEFCKLDLLRQVLRRVGAPVQLHVVEDANHRLRVLRRTSKRKNEEVHAEVHGALESWMANILEPAP